MDLSLSVQLWRCIMSSVEWNKKEELVAEQALKHLKVSLEFRKHNVTVHVKMFHELAKMFFG